MATGAFARGGWLSIASGQLMWRNDKADRLLTGDAQFTASLDQIRCASIVDPRFSIYNLFNGGLLRKRLKVETAGGDTRLFVLRDPWSILNQLHEAAGIPACQQARDSTVSERVVSAVAFLLLASSLVILTTGPASQSWLPLFVGVGLLVPVLGLITLTRPKE